MKNPKSMKEILQKCIVKENGCLEWPGRRLWNGYGVVTKGLTHRIVLAEKLGRPLLNGELACHHCDNPPCCNPEHLFPGTSLDNCRDKFRKNRQADLSGDRNPNARLTAQDVIKIRSLYSEGASLEELSQLYGVDKATIHRAATKRTWRNLQCA